MKRNDKYNLYGYIEFVPIEAGFVTPVFTQSDKLYLEISSNNKIEDFEIIPDNYREAIKIEVTNSKHELKQGDDCWYAFKWKETILYGSSDMLIKELWKPDIYKKLSNRTQISIRNFFKKNNNFDEI